MAQMAQSLANLIAFVQATLTNVFGFIEEVQNRYPHQPPPVEGFKSKRAGSEARPKLPNWLIILSGIQCYCGVSLLFTPYAVFEGGWRSILFLGVYGVCAGFTSYLYGLCFADQGNITTYGDMGYASFGVKGRYVCLITSIFFSYASCVESVLVVREILASLFPKELITVIHHGLTLGVSTTLLLVVALVFHPLEKDVEYRPESGDLFKLPTVSMTIGFFAYCFAGHTNLPELRASMTYPDQYNELLCYFFGPSCVIYFVVASVGYATFGAKVSPMFILSMRKHRVTTYLAIVCTVANHVIRYMLGVCAMGRTIDQLTRNQNTTTDGDNPAYLGMALRLIIVLTTIPVSIMVPFYGLLMAFLGSFLGTLTALVIPCVCFLSIHWGNITRRQAVVCVTVILMGLIAAGFGMEKSISEMVKYLAS